MNIYWPITHGMICYFVFNYCWLLFNKTIAECIPGCLYLQRRWLLANTSEIMCCYLNSLSYRTRLFQRKSVVNPVSLTELWFHRAKETGFVWHTSQSRGKNQGIQIAQHISYVLYNIFFNTIFSIPHFLNHKFIHSITRVTKFSFN